MKKPPTRKPARAKGSPTTKLFAQINRLTRERDDARASLNTANACVAKQIERIRELTHERDEKQCTIDRLCRANEAMAGEIETLKGKAAAPTVRDSQTVAPPLKVGDVIDAHVKTTRDRVPIGTKVRLGADATPWTVVYCMDGSEKELYRTSAEGYHQVDTGHGGDWIITSLPPAPLAEQPAKPRTGVVVDVEAGDTWQRPIHPTITFSHILQVRGDKYRPVGGGCCGNWMDNSVEHRRSDITPAEARAQIETWGHEWREQPVATPQPRTRTLWAAEYERSGAVCLNTTELGARKCNSGAEKFYPLTFTEPQQ